MEFRHLELLREFADRGSVTAVAEATYRTPSAVSQQLKTAQREAGMALVEPHGRGLRLTEAGRLLAAGGADVAAALARVEARWDAFRGEPAGVVRIASLPSAATFLMPPVLAALAGSGIEVAVSDYDVAEAEYADLTADNDIVVAHSLTSARPAGTRSEAVVPLAREPLDVAMSSAHPLAARGHVTATEAAGCAWIGVPVGYPFDTVLQSLSAVTSVELDVRQRIRDNRLIEALVAESSLVAILPRFTTPSGGGLVLRELRGVPSLRHVCAVMRPDRAERLAVRRVVAALRAAGAAAEERGVPERRC
ncbi:LysR family transcriptional regulator [Zhihengliuella halotolerans]|uniref:DNA-binding transcriptional LysR family regulator n=1 Tax=Zhihengliuella halotolerans TaxID=370736 RepID=A0A4Q8AHS9_9MICC|nr:LysR family transcriptional regulator [Zhihengliuella halotolerans]RZU63375.1 DNA-binding transcriptional LysR family regulator [Zhihengliuella halotolerans]